MALYLGSSEINPVETVEVIKEVPTEKDLTLMGNELRRACAYTNVQEGSGKYQLAYFSNSELYKSSELYNGICKTYSSLITADGVSSSVGVSNSQLKVTRISNFTDWNILVSALSSINSYTGIRNNKLYVKNAFQGDTISNYILCYSGMIIDGKLYYLDYSQSILLDDTGVWTSAYCSSNYSWDVKASGIRNGYFTVKSSTYGISVFGDFSLRDDWSLSCTGYPSYAKIITITDNLEIYSISFNNNSFTPTKLGNLQKTPLKIFSKSDDYTFSKGFVILNTDNTLDFYNSSGTLNLEVSNCKGYVPLSTADLILKDNGNLYKLNSNNLVLLENIGENAQISTGLNFGYSNSVMVISYLDTNPVYTTLYVPSTIGTNAYVNTESLSAKIITTTTSNSITVDGREYFRDSTKDSIFKFVPTELANHTFTDQELCQAYLNAGFIQQNS